MAVSIRRSLLERRWPWWVASLGLTLGLFVATVAGWLWYVDQRDAQARRSSLDLLWLEQSLQRSLETERRMLLNWAQDLAAGTPAAQAEFRGRITELMRERRALIAVDFVDVAGRRVVGLPEYTERPEQLPPLSDPLIAAAVSRSRTLNQPAYSQVIEQGAPLWVLALPVADESGGRRGAVLATYDLDRLLELEVPWWFIQRYDLSLVDRSHKRLAPRDGPVPEGEVHALAFGPEDSGLALWAAPHLHGQPRALTLGLGALVLGLAALIVWLLRVLARWLRAEREAARTVRQRDELLQHTARLSSLAEFASGIAHELNQPLAAIANYSAVADSYLAQPQPPFPKLQDVVARLGEEAHRAGQIIQSLRSFIQKRAVEHRRHRVMDLLHEPLALLEPLAQRAQVRVRLQVEAADAEIDCDAVMIEQVVFNLLRNALEAVAALPAPPPDDAVTVQLQGDADSVSLTVADRGPGIAEPARLFQAFYTTKPEGMGLGLAICRTVVESHGGRLWAEDNPGGGARLVVRLPRSRPETP